MEDGKKKQCDERGYRTAGTRGRERRTRQTHRRRVDLMDVGQQNTNDL